MNSLRTFSFSVEWPCSSSSSAEDSFGFFNVIYALHISSSFSHPWRLNRLLGKAYGWDKERAAYCCSPLNFWFLLSRTTERFWESSHKSFVCDSFFESALSNTWDTPPPNFNELPKTTWYSHGLPRNGARTWLSSWPALGSDRSWYTVLSSFFAYRSSLPCRHRSLFFDITTFVDFEYSVGTTPEAKLEESTFFGLRCLRFCCLASVHSRQRLCRYRISHSGYLNYSFLRTGKVLGSPRPASTLAETARICGA